MTVEALQRCLAQCLPEEITEFEQIPIGVSNEAYAVTCKSGQRYVIRVIRAQTAESVRAEALIQKATIANGLSTPRYLPLAGGGFVGHDGGTAFTVAEFIEGSHPAQPSLKLAESFGTVMARLHDILDQNTIAIGYNTGQWLHPRNVRSDIDRCDEAKRALLLPVIEKTLPLFEADLPKAIIHGELAMNNVFAEDDRITTIFDFETTEYAPRLLDLAYTYLSFLYDEALPPDEVLSALRNGYDGAAAVKLSSLEAEYFGLALHYASAATAAWCFARGYDEYGRQFFSAGTMGVG